jgi:hypothetical protein
MPPYAEKQSPLLVRLKQKKPLMEADSTNNEHSVTSTQASDVPKLSATAVSFVCVTRKKSDESISLLLFSYKLTNRNHHMSISNNNSSSSSSRTVSYYHSIHRKRMVITLSRNRNRRRCLKVQCSQRENFYLKIVILSSKMIFYKLVLNYNRLKAQFELNFTMEIRARAT